MTTSGVTRLNGVDVDQLMGTISHIREQPELARFTFRTRTEWLGGAHSRSSIRGFYGAGREDTSRQGPMHLEGDEPAVLLGTDQAPNAVETLLHALASCLAVGFVYNAAAKGIEVRDLELEVEGDLDLHGFLGLSEDTRAGFEGIQVRYSLESNVPREQLVELCEHVQRTSPLLDMLSNPVPVSISLVE